MSPRPDVSESRKNQIIDAAMVVFTKLGFQQARMDDIVEESGLSKGALYWYFKSKDEIITATVEKMLNNELAQVDRLMQNEGPVADLVIEFIEFAVEDFLKLEPLAPMLYEFYALAIRSKTLRKMFTKYFERYVQSITPLIQRGIDEGEFHNANAEDITLALGALIEGTFLLKAYAPKTINLEHHIRTGARLLIQGITKE
jgi:AcrR family transcriptional regulator